MGFAFSCWERRWARLESLLTVGVGAECDALRWPGVGLGRNPVAHAPTLIANCRSRSTSPGISASCKQTSPLSSASRSTQRNVSTLVSLKRILAMSILRTPEDLVGILMPQISGFFISFSARNSLAKVGVEGSSPFAHSIFSASPQRSGNPPPSGGQIVSAPCEADRFPGKRTRGSL
jgi:hypothetical protein